MAVQWVQVCTQDTAPAATANGLDCLNGSVQVVAYQYLDAGTTGFNALFNLSVPDATAVGFAVLGVWIVAWGFRMAIKSLKEHQNETE